MAEILNIKKEKQGIGQRKAKTNEQEVQDGGKKKKDPTPTGNEPTQNTAVDRKETQDERNS